MVLRTLQKADLTKFVRLRHSAHEVADCQSATVAQHPAHHARQRAPPGFLLGVVAKHIIMSHWHEREAGHCSIRSGLRQNAGNAQRDRGTVLSCILRCCARHLSVQRQRASWRNSSAGRVRPVAPRPRQHRHLPAEVPVLLLQRHHPRVLQSRRCQIHESMSGKIKMLSDTQPSLVG
jgi:hypothetical protein